MKPIPARGSERTNESNMKETDFNVTFFCRATIVPSDTAFAVLIFPSSNLHDIFAFGSSPQYVLDLAVVYNTTAVNDPKKPGTAITVVLRLLDE